MTRVSLPPPPGIRSGSAVRAAAADLLQRARPRPHRPCLLAISGYTGSGKSSLAKMLVRRLSFTPILLVTTRPPAATEQAGVDYHFTTEADFMAGLQNGEIIGCEGGYGAYYGVRRADLTALANSRQNGVVVVGASLMDSLRSHLSEKPGLLFRSILVRLAGTPAERHAEVVRRIEKRAREEGRAATDRLAKVSPEALQAYDTRAVYYDYELVNGDFNAAGEELRTYARRVQQGETTGKTTRVPIRNTPGIILSRYLWRNLLTLIATRLSQIDFSTYISNIQGIKELLAADLHNIMRRIYQEVHGGQPPGERAEEAIKKILGHVLDVTSGIMQNREKLEQLIAEKKGIGRLAIIPDQARARHNLERLLAIAQSYSDRELLLLALFHDLTKLDDWYLHPERSYPLLERLDLLANTAIPAADQQLLKLTTRYHVLFTSCLMADYSGKSFINFLQDPEVQQYLLVNGQVDQARAQRLLDSLLLLTVADVSPYGAALTNLKFEKILDYHDWLLAKLHYQSGSYPEVIKSLGSELPALNRQYLGMILGISDPEMDSRPNINYYWEQVAARLDELVAQEELTTAEKAYLENNLHLITGSAYPPLNYLSRVTAAGQISGGWQAKPLAAFFKYLIFNIQLTSQLRRPGKELRFCFQNAAGHYLSEKEGLQAAALDLINLFSAGAVQIGEVKDGRIPLLNAAGEPVETIAVNLNEFGLEGAREINFRFYNIP